MAEVKLSKGTEEWQMFVDYWAFCQKYWGAERTDAYWDNLIAAADEFAKKYNTPFATKLALAFLEAKNLEVTGGGNGK